MPALTLVAPLDNPTLLGMTSSAVQGIPPVEAFVDFEVHSLELTSPSTPNIKD